MVKSSLRPAALCCMREEKMRQKAHFLPQPFSCLCSAGICLVSSMGQGGGVGPFDTSFSFSIRHRRSALGSGDARREQAYLGVKGVLEDFTESFGVVLRFARLRGKQYGGFNPLGHGLAHELRRELHSPGEERETARMRCADGTDQAAESSTRGHSWQPFPPSRRYV